MELIDDLALQFSALWFLAKHLPKVELDCLSEIVDFRLMDEDVVCSDADLSRV